MYPAALNYCGQAGYGQYDLSLIDAFSYAAGLSPVGSRLSTRQRQQRRPAINTYALHSNIHSGTWSMAMRHGIRPEPALPRLACHNVKTMILTRIFRSLAGRSCCVGNASVTAGKKVGRALRCPPRRARSARPTIHD